MCHSSLLLPIINYYHPSAAVTVVFVHQFLILLLPAAVVFGTGGSSSGGGGLYPTINYDDEEVVPQQDQIVTNPGGSSSREKTRNKVNKPAPGAMFANNAQNVNGNVVVGYTAQPLQYQGASQKQVKNQSQPKKGLRPAPGAMFSNSAQQQQLQTTQTPNYANYDSNYEQHFQHAPAAVHYIDPRQKNQTVPPTSGPSAFGTAVFQQSQQQQFQQPSQPPNYPMLYTGDGMAPANAHTAAGGGFAPNYYAQQQQPQNLQMFAQPQQPPVAPVFEPVADLLLPEPIPDLLTDDPPSPAAAVSFQQQHQLVVPSSPVDSLMDQLSIEEPNRKGTMEIYYTEVTLKKEDKSGSKSSEILVEIYRQRDNSGNFVKFRHVDKLSGDTLFSCLAPLPPAQKGMIKLFFNNNPTVEYEFDVTGYMIVPEEQFSVDRNSGKPDAGVKRLYTMKEFQEWIKKSINALVEDKKARKLPQQPSDTQQSPPVAYPPGSVLQWVGLPLPVHPMLVEQHFWKIGFVNVDVKKKMRPLTHHQQQQTPSLSNNNEPDQIMEQMDDGGNWLKIEVKQQYKTEPGQETAKKPKYSSATFVRDPNGQAPNINGPMVLFFNGHRWYFDKTAMAISRGAVDALRKWKQKKLQQKRGDPEMEKFLAHNRALLAEEQAKANKKATVAQQQPAAASNNYVSNQQQPIIMVPNPYIMVPSQQLQMQQHYGQPVMQQPQMPLQQQMGGGPSHSYRYYMNPMNQQLNAQWNSKKTNQQRQQQQQQPFQMANGNQPPRAVMGQPAAANQQQGLPARRNARAKPGKGACQTSQANC